MRGPWTLGARRPNNPSTRHFGAGLATRFRPRTPSCPAAAATTPQADCLEEVEAQLARRGVPYVRQKVVEEGIVVQQLFFHDPDNNMIEVGAAEIEGWHWLGA